MKGRQAAIVLGAFLGSLVTQGLSAGDNDRAVPRGGGSSGGGSRGGGSHGGGGSAAAARHPGSSGGSGGSSHSGSSRSASRGPRTGAQSRQPVPGTGRAYYPNRYGGYYGGHHGGYYPYYSHYYWPYSSYYYGYYSPWYYPGFYGSFGWPYGGLYAGFGYPYYGGGYYGAAYYGGESGGGYGGGGDYERAGSVRVIVEPTDAKVYVDEYYAGKVDDFDGIFQRLDLKPGRHDITIKREGYETHKVKLFVPLGDTLKIKHKMVRGSSERISEQTVGDPADGERYARRAEEERARPETDGRYEPQDRRGDPSQQGGEFRYPPPDRGGEPRDDSWSASRERGSLRLDVFPADASIYVDGVFRGTGQDLRRLNLPPGRHRVEVVRPGYRTFERDVEVRAGETEEVDIALDR